MASADGLNSITGAEHIGPVATGDNIEAKRVAPYYWDGSNWQRSVGSTPPLATRLDSTTTNITYVGKATIGTATSAASWQIFKMDETTANTLIITWAAGASAFTNIWDNRTGLAYS